MLEFTVSGATEHGLYVIDMALMSLLSKIFASDMHAPIACRCQSFGPAAGQSGSTSRVF